MRQLANQPHEKRVQAMKYLLFTQEVTKHLPDEWKQARLLVAKARALTNQRYKDRWLSEMKGVGA
jgi:hypothetical protein